MCAKYVLPPGSLHTCIPDAERTHTRARQLHTACTPVSPTERGLTCVLNMSCRLEACTPASEMQRGLTPEQTTAHCLQASVTDRERTYVCAKYVLPPGSLHACIPDAGRTPSRARQLHPACTPLSLTERGLTCSPSICCSPGVASLCALIRILPPRTAAPHPALMYRSPARSSTILQPRIPFPRTAATHPDITRCRPACSLHVPQPCMQLHRTAAPRLAPCTAARMCTAALHAASVYRSPVCSPTVLQPHIQSPCTAAPHPAILYRCPTYSPPIPPPCM